MKFLTYSLILFGFGLFVDVDTANAQTASCTYTVRSGGVTVAYNGSGNRRTESNCKYSISNSFAARCTSVFGKRSAPPSKVNFGGSAKWGSKSYSVRGTCTRTNTYNGTIKGDIVVRSYSSLSACKAGSNAGSCARKYTVSGTQFTGQSASSGSSSSNSGARRVVTLNYYRYYNTKAKKWLVSTSKFYCDWHRRYFSRIDRRTYGACKFERGVTVIGGRLAHWYMTFDHATRNRVRSLLGYYPTK